MSRDRPPWSRMDPTGKFALLLVGCGIAPAWLRNIVYWHEDGVGFFPQGPRMDPGRGVPTTGGCS